MKLDPETVAEQADLFAIAEAQAEKDLELLRALNARKDNEQEPFVITTDDTEATEESIIEPRVPMNRAERRQQVKLYALLLREGEKQRPYVAPTVIPKSKRRRKPGRKGRLAHA